MATPLPETPIPLAETPLAPTITPTPGGPGPTPGGPAVPTDPAPGTPAYQFYAANLPPIMHQFPQWISREQHQATVDARQVKTIQDLTNVVNSQLTRITQLISSEAAANLKSIMDPFYLFYAQSQPPTLDAQNQYGYPGYSYFLGYAQTMLGGLTTLATHLMSKCAPEITDINHVNMDTTECAAAKLSDLVTLATQHRENPTDLVGALHAFLTQSEGIDGNDVQKILDQLFLTQQWLEESQTRTEIEGALGQMDHQLTWLEENKKDLPYEDLEVDFQEVKTALTDDWHRSMLRNPDYSGAVEIRGTLDPDGVRDGPESADDVDSDIFESHVGGSDMVGDCLCPTRGGGEFHESCVEYRRSRTALDHRHQCRD